MFQSNLLWETIKKLAGIHNLIPCTTKQHHLIYDMPQCELLLIKILIFHYTINSFPKFLLYQCLVKGYTHLILCEKNVWW